MDCNRKTEILAPAGSVASMEAALCAGADAVYMGGSMFGARAYADNPDEELLLKVIDYVHLHGRKIYLTVNTLLKDSELAGLGDYLMPYYLQGLDAVIVQDIGVMQYIRRHFPGLALHVSTQAAVTNEPGAAFFKETGADRIVPARELSLREIRRMQEKTGLEIECFVHGAMCIAYSGRCLLSNYMTGRDANQGACTHPCRWKYAVVEESRPGEYLPVYENERGTFLFNSGDLCMIEHIPQLLEAGIDSLKIEGRMKTALYVATVARTYRRAIDDYLESEECYRKNMDWYKQEIGKCTYRQFTTGFYFGKPGRESQIYDSSTYQSEAVYLAMIEKTDEQGYAYLEQKNKFYVGDVVEIMKPDGRNIPVRVEAMVDEEGIPMESCPHAKQKFSVRLSEKPDPCDLLRMLQ